MTNTQTTHYNPGTTDLFVLFIKGNFHRVVAEDDYQLREFMHCLGFERILGSLYMDRAVAANVAVALGSSTPFTADKFLSYTDKEVA